ncbi:Cyclin-dependent kinase 6 [Fasciola gigantica]|uniref:Cyclin-dependent kinase 6 n=1 Tax=Fasciola gigantica TaxID=46835 RepID=A0A504Z9V9_FASGI|nr:Cyclin-dependent kinase 6 [Fasciola gigantica]
MDAVSFVRKHYENRAFRCMYKPSELVGKGTYGRVFKGTSPNGAVVALKEIIVDPEEGIPLSTLRELSVLRKIQSYNSPHLVQMLDVSVTTLNNALCIYVVFEYVECDLARFLSQHAPRNGLPPETIRDLSEQLLRGTDFLHSHRIVHRDLKPANILIDRDGRQLKITDFGLARVLGWEAALTPVVVTLWYRAPEILIQSEYLSPCDIWAAGCIIAELFNLKPLFPKDNELAMMVAILQTLGFPADCDWPALSYLKKSDFRSVGRKTSLRGSVNTTDSAALDLLERMIMFNPKRRITASDALSLPYFHPRPNTFPGLPFQSRSSHQLSTMATNPPTHSHRKPVVPTLMRQHRHSTIPTHMPQTCASAVLCSQSRSGTQTYASVARQALACSGSSGWDEVDSAISVHSTSNSSAVASVRISNSNAATMHKTQRDTTLSGESDQLQQELLISVVKHAIGEEVIAEKPSSWSAPASVSSVSPTVASAPGRRPVTRQQTRATRRYTQPTVSSAPMACTTGSWVPPVSVSLTTVSEHEVKQNVENGARAQRPRKTARRRTIIGVANAAAKESVILAVPIIPASTVASILNGQRVNDVKNARAMVTSKSLIGRQSLTAAPLHIHDHYWPQSSESAPNEQHYHQRLNKLLERHQIKQLKHLRNGQPSPGLSRSGRYSLGPTSSLSTLMPVCEVPRLESVNNHYGESYSRTVSGTGQLNGSIQVGDCKPNPTACSPSKLARISTKSCCIAPPLPPPSNHTSRSTDPLLLVSTVPGPAIQNPQTAKVCHALDDEEDVSEIRLHNEEVYAEDEVNADTEDPDSHVVNTSLGINSAMTGLALVTRTQSISSQNSGCDTAGFIATPSPTVSST